MKKVELKIKRTILGDTFTKGEWYANGNLICYSLEDKDRGLKSTDTLEEIQKKKVFGKTAIPTGKYKVIITFSPKFQKYLPVLVDVKGYAGVRIHPGNKSKDTEGCLLPGSNIGKPTVDFIPDSVKAYNKILAIIHDADDVTIEIVSEY